MNMYERFALGQYMSGYPVDLHFDEVLELIENDDEEAVIWQPFADWSKQEVVRLICDLRDDLEREFVARLR